MGGVYWVLYLFLPVNSAVFLRRLRGLPRPATRPTPQMRSTALIVIALGVGGYGAALALVPEWATSFWPWPVDDFHGRLYAATYFTGATGALLQRRAAAPAEHATYGAMVLAFGTFVVAGLLLTNATVPPERQVALTEPGGVAFIAVHALFALVGLVVALWGAPWRPGLRHEPVSEEGV